VSEIDPSVSSVEESVGEPLMVVDLPPAYEPPVVKVAGEVVAIPLSEVRMTSDGVCLSRVERDAEGVIVKVLEV
jgi:hypothetical protein